MPRQPRLGKHLMFKFKYAESILNEGKITTIRLGKIKVKSKEFYIHAGGRILAKARLEEIKYKKFRDLTEEDARADGFGSLEELREELKKIYPKIKDHSWVTIIKFRIKERLDIPEDSIYTGKTGLEIAKLAEKNMDKLNLSSEEELVLKTLLQTESIRETARRIYGSIHSRRKIRSMLLKVARKLKELGCVDDQDQ